jgi:hypothetical protein
MSIRIPPSTPTHVHASLPMLIALAALGLTLMTLSLTAF